MPIQQGEVRTIRIFGATGAEVAGVLRKANQNGCQGLRLLTKDSEFVIKLQSPVPNSQKSAQITRRWENYLRDQFGDNVYGVGDTSLAQASLAALMHHQHEVVAANEATGRILSAVWKDLPQAETVYDFGKKSYRNKKIEPQMRPMPGIRFRFPGDPVQEYASLAENTRQVTGADFAVIYAPHEVGFSAFVLISTNRACWACPVPNKLSPMGIANYLLDMLRRMSCGMKPLLGTVTIRPGRPGPELGTCAIDVRIPSIRATEGVEPSRAQAIQDFEMLHLPNQMAMAGANGDLEGEHTLEFLLNWSPERFISDGRAAAAAANMPGDPFQQLSEDFLDAPLNQGVDFGPRRESVYPRNPQEQVEEEELPRNSLDVISDTVQLELDRIQAQGYPDPREQENRPAAGGNKMKDAARRIYDEINGTGEEAQDEVVAGLQKAARSHRRQGNLIMAAAIFILLLAAGVFLAAMLRRGHLKAPEYRGYGTSDFDAQAQSYLTEMQREDSGVEAYLAWPGQTGSIIYGHTASGITLTAQAEGQLSSATLGRSLYNTIIYTDNGEGSPAGMNSREMLAGNAGFTLYEGDKIYRYKVIGVYYWDGQESGRTAFALKELQNLSNYQDYVDFVVGVKSRSMYDIPVKVGQRESFVTLLAPQEGMYLAVTGKLVAENEDRSLVPSAIQENRDALMPLRTYNDTQLAMEQQAQGYAHWLGWFTGYTMEQGQQPEVSLPAENEPERNNTDTGLSGDIAALLAEADRIMANNQKLLATLTDVKGNASASESDIHQGAEGELPSTTITVEQLIGSLATPAPTPTPTPTPTPSSPAEENPQEETPSQQPSQAPEETPAPQPEQPQQPQAEMITVTMNGTVQTLELTECLAMVARNELGANAPDEAYKAQMVATHCWILSQGGAPSVAGMAPNDHLRALAREVAHVLITYNGQVCFTPYFASASTGTVSSADTWGGERAWLQAVESPYDQQYASNWHTNGNSSGTAIYSRAALQERILEKLGIDLSELDPSQWFTIIKANKYGWIGQDGIQIGQGSNSTTCSGRWFRETLTAGRSLDGRSLRSSCFTVSYDSTKDAFIFDVYGYGHGCGLSQWGAIGYAKNGWSYQDILRHYYTGVTLTTY